MASSQVSIQNSLSSGELSPSIWGRTDLEKYHNGTSTCRNFFANYRGGIMSRAGFAYCGTCKQQYPNPAPRLIPFQFNLTQGFVLEFGGGSSPGTGYMRILSDGAYVTEAAQYISAITNANPGVVTYANISYTVANGDWVYISGDAGNLMKQTIDNLPWVVSGVSGATYNLVDMFGTTLDTTSLGAYTGGSASTASRIYTIVSPFAAQDLPYLKYVQSADTMTLTCVNTDTGTEYRPYTLTRTSNTNWVFAEVVFGNTVSSPTGLAASATSSTTVDTWYSYSVTAVSNGAESVSSAPVSIENNDISLNAGSNALTWNNVTGADYYNVYGATPSYSVAAPASVQFGFIGTSLAPGFVDTNIIPDFTMTPPIHDNPFAEQAIIGVTPTANGSGYTQATIGYTVTGAGTGFIGIPVVNGGEFVGFIIQNGGSGYSGTPTIAITDSGGGTGATATLVVGPATGTRPGVSAYFQQRQVYANTLNQPDTYWMSQPGQFRNFDASIPVIDSDSIEGTPWAVQVNGIQWLVPMPGGLVVLTGNGAWQVNGGSQAAITPSDQTATPQAYNGTNNLVPPIVRNYDILYLQAKGSIFRDLSYNFFVNIYTGTDLTVLSDHLFTDFSMVQWCSSEEPYKLLWVVRSDGQMLCLTYVKEQDVYSWTRHDTNGLFQSVCAVTELPVDAVYVVVQRYVQGAWRYYTERMDNRLWQNVEEVYCVDAGLQSPIGYPDSTLSPAAATGTGVSFQTDIATFSAGNVGQIIRVGGGKGTVASYVDSTHVTVNITEPITEVITDDPNSLPVPHPPGAWSISSSVTTVYALNHLNGLTVSILADGSVIPPQVVTNNQITLPYPASLVTIGLPYVCQAQTLYLDHPQEKGDTTQNRRKNISAVGLRVANSRGLKLGADQVDQSSLQNFPPTIWNNLVELRERSPQNFAGVAIPLYTGDYYTTITSGWNLKGQIAIQQDYPLPAQILACVAYWIDGDDR